MRATLHRFGRGPGLATAGLLLLAAATLPSWAQTVEVDDDNCPGPGTGTPGDPFCKIQDAICHLKNAGGGTVSVHPGTYNESLRMFDGVDVVSLAGPQMTTIDGSGQPCTRADCGVNTATTSCSTVVYGFEGGSARLEGFRITGGAGIDRDVSGRKFVAGGGIFMVGDISPVITGNEISGNVLSSTLTTEYLGAGIYVEGLTQTQPATPTITNNTIADNINDPIDGTGPSAVSYALGGGVYLGLYTATVLEGNTIRNNQAGDPAKSFVRARGGGMAVYSWAAEPTISRNVIESNSSSDVAGGVMMGDLQAVATQALVENNVFQYNRAEGAGGALSTGTTTARVRSNTFVDNSAGVYGGGLYVGQPAFPPFQTQLVNNLVTFNSVSYYYPGQFVGGGMYVDAAPLVSYNDLYGNIPDNVGGQKRDSDYVGSNGNISADPAFVSRNPPNRFLGLTSGSPAVDTGNDLEAPPTDISGAPRIVDGDGDAVAHIDLGAYEFDPNAADFDGDGLPDSVDPDDDNDGVNDVSDCDPFNASVAQVAGPVGATLRVDRNGGIAELSWGRGIQGFVSNVYRGDLAAPWGYNETCFDPETPATTSSDNETPTPGGGFYYLVSAKNSCGESRIGRDNLGGIQSDLFPLAPCASQGGDFDGDAVLDVRDNCPLDVNPGQEDPDHDFFGDPCDCSPLDASNLPPGMVGGVVVDHGVSSTDVSWSDLGVGRYDVGGGLLSEIRIAGGVSGAVCLEDDSTDTLYQDMRADPPSGDGHYYLIRAQNDCGGGSWGITSTGAERFPAAACP